MSRVTDPKNFSLVGIPPRDLIEDLAQELLRQGIDVDAFFEKACQVTADWKYERSMAKVVDRIQQKFCNERTVPLKFRTLAECLNPQPEAHVVFQRLLDWIDRCDVASQTAGEPKPSFQTADGEPIFPEDEGPWWLTDISRRLTDDAKQDGDEDGPATEGEEEGEQRELSDEEPVSDPEQHVCASASSQHELNLKLAWDRHA